MELHVGFVIGDDRVHCFTFTYQVSEQMEYIRQKMRELIKKVNEDPNNFSTIFNLYREFSETLGVSNVEIVKPLHVGPGYIINQIEIFRETSQEALFTYVESV